MLNLKRLKAVFLFIALAAFLTLPAAMPYAQDEEEPDYQAALDEVTDSIKYCASISSRVDRLICYDDFSKKLGYIASDKAEREEEVLQQYGFWEVSKRRTAAGEEIIYLKNNSIEEIVSRSGLRRKPTLVIKCSRGETNVYLDWKAKIITSHYSGVSTMQLLYQYDASEKKPEKWELSTDGNALFSPRPVDMVRDMRQHNRIVFTLTPGNDITQTIVHDISGLDSVIDILVDECYYGHLKDQETAQ